MKYDVCPIIGAAIPSFREHQGPNAIADEIAKAYNIVSTHGGRIIAAHNLTCDLDLAQEGEQSNIARTNFLFLVVEFPDDVVSPWEEDDPEA